MKSFALILLITFYTVSLSNAQDSVRAYSRFNKMQTGLNFIVQEDNNYYHDYFSPVFFPVSENSEPPLLKLTAYPDSLVAFYDYELSDYTLGMRLVLANYTNASIKFQTQAGQMFIIQEARDSTGEWKPIEYWAYSACGNSYLGFSFKLPPGHFIKLSERKYDGEFSTFLRFKLRYFKKGYSTPLYLCSEPFEGKVNKEQFKTPVFSDGLYQIDFFSE
jgi:hypothetical protein